MSTAVLEKLCDERDETRAAAIAIAESDSFSPDDPTFKDLQTRAEELDRRVASLSTLMEQRQAADQLDGRLAKSKARQDQVRQESTGVQVRSLGAAFTESTEFRGYNGRGTSGRFDFDMDPQTRALPTGLADLVAAGFKGAPYQVDTSPNVAPTPLMDNITQIMVSGNSIEYVAWTKKAGGAAKVAEKAAKPSAEFGPTVTPGTLDTFAVYTQLTRQLIEDQAAVRTIIDQELRRDVARAEEADAATVLAAASASIPDVVNADLLSGIRIGMGTVQAAGYTPTGVLVNPADYAKLDIAVFASNATGPTVGQSFWGLTPIPSSAQAAGTAVVGDFRSAVHHYYRSAISLYATDSHDVTFLANVITLLAERRGKTVVVRPQALVEAKIA